MFASSFAETLVTTAADAVAGGGDLIAVLESLARRSM